VSLRPPKGLNGTRRETLASALEVEIAREMASALGRLGHRLEQSLAVLRDFDSLHASKPAADVFPARRRLVAEAGAALWHFIVQREACGLRDSRRIFEDYGVPAEVRNRMGIAAAAPERETAAVRPARGK